MKPLSLVCSALALIFLLHPLEAFIVDDSARPNLSTANTHTTVVDSYLPESWGLLRADPAENLLGCHDELLSHYSFSTPSWCSILNPFSTQEQPIFSNNESVWTTHTKDASWHWKPFCHTTDSLPFGIANRTCTAVSAFASGKVGTTDFVLYGHYTGWVTFHHFTASSRFLYQFNYLGKHTPSEDNAIRWLDVLTPPKPSFQAPESSILLVGTATRVSLFQFNSSFISFTKIDEFVLHPLTERFVSAKFFLHSELTSRKHPLPPVITFTPYAMITIQNIGTQEADIHFRSLNPQAPVHRDMWHVSPGSENLSMSIASQAVSFKGNTPVPSTGTVDRDALFYRNILLLHNGLEVKLLHLVPNTTDAGGAPINIIFGNKKSVTSFYFVQDEHPGASIADAQLVGDNIRHFQSEYSCHSVQFAPSQSMLLLIAIYAQEAQEDVDTMSWVDLRDVPEMQLYNQSEGHHTISATILNPANRPFASDEFPCFNAFFNVLTQSCEPVHTLNYSLDAGVRATKLEVRSVNSLQDTFRVSSVPKVCAFLRDSESCYVAMKNIDESCVASKLRFEWEQGIFVHNFLSVFVLTQSGDTLAPSVPNNVLVLAYQWYLDPKTKDRRESFALHSAHEYVGRVDLMHVTQNGLYSYVSVERPEWQFDSFKRYSVICQQLTEDPTNVFLQPFKETCSLPIQLDLGFFIRFNSFCPPGKLCTSVDAPVVSEALMEGFFTLLPNLNIPCPEGKFCLNGLIYDCPPGFRCAAVSANWWLKDWKDLLPVKCQRSDYSDPSTPWYSARTCAQLNTGKIPPLCPSGSVCLNSASLPVPVPPSYRMQYTEDERTLINTSTLSPVVSQCDPGMWCPLGAFEIDLHHNDSHTSNTSSLLCPAGTYCVDPGVTTPSLCECSEEECDYCPAGSVFHMLCPSGKYCPGPQRALDCPAGYSCPMGTVFPTLCSAGSYCDGGIPRVCPEGSYCKKGSVQPTRCSILSYCPEGSEREVIPTLSILIVLATLSLVCAVYFILGTLIPLIRAARNKSVTGQPDVSESSPLLAKKLRKTFHVSFQNLEVKLRDNRTILHSTSGNIYPGRVFCVLGGSGAGKTTFISALRGILGEQAKVNGRILINGHSSSMAQYASYTAFIPQEDVMSTDLTVRENLFFSSRVKLSLMHSNKEINQVVDETLRDLGLEQVQHQIIGNIESRGISGGERRRTSLALGLVQNPSIIVADEITSGLDAYSAHSLMRCLKRITKRGYTVVVILHQPSVQIFDLLDDIHLLGKGGHTIFSGPKDEVIDYFETHNYEFPANMNPCDYLIDISSGVALPKNAESTDATYNILKMARIWRRNNRASTTIAESRRSWRNSFPFSLSTTTDDNILSVQQNPLSSVGVNSPTVDDHSPSKFYSSVSEDRGSWIKETLTQRSSLTWQFIMCVLRSFIQQIRDMRGLLLELSLIGFSSACLGIVFGNKPGYIGSVPREDWMQCPVSVRSMCRAPLQDTVIQICYLASLSLYLVGSVTSLKLFGGYEKVTFARESAHLRSLPYFVGKNIASIPNLLFAPALYLLILRFLIGFHTDFFPFYGIFLASYVVASGIGQCLAMLLPWNVSLLASVILSLTQGFFAGNVPPIPEIRSMIVPVCWFPIVNPLRWSQEVLYLMEMRYYEKTNNDIQWSLEKRDYDFSHLWTGVYVLLGWTVLIRVVAYVLLVCTMPGSLCRRAVGRVSWIILDVQHRISSLWKRVLTRSNAQNGQYHEI